jgi:hypothetical protein
LAFLLLLIEARNLNSVLGLWLLFWLPTLADLQGIRLGFLAFDPVVFAWMELHYVVRMEGPYGYIYRGWNRRNRVALLCPYLQIPGTESSHSLALPIAAKLLNASAPGLLDEALARKQLGDMRVYYMNEQSGASNAKAKRDFNWQPAIPSWRTGFEALYLNKSRER